jgi:hypothetical protein
LFNESALNALEVLMGLPFIEFIRIILIIAAAVCFAFAYSEDAGIHFATSAITPADSMVIRKESEPISLGFAFARHQSPKKTNEWEVTAT